MVKRWEKRPGGRPRAYGPEIALERAMEAFCDGGFSGTSLDDLSAGRGMNRPSLYAAFGGKHALYLKTLESYRARRPNQITAALGAGRPLAASLRSLYSRMI